MAIEVGGQTDGGVGDDVYVKFDVEPVLSLDDIPVSVSFPITLGRGLAANTPVPLLKFYGAWEVRDDVHMLSFDDALTTLNGSDGNQAVDTIGFNTRC